MAMKLCRECKKEISTDANPCPHCGKKNPHGMSKLLKYGGGAVGALIIISVAASSSKTQDEAKHNAAGGAAVAAPSAAPAPAAAPAAKSFDLTVDAMKLWKDYDANEVAADGLYKGKNLQVTGVVASIDKDFMDNIVLHLKAPNEFMDTWAKLEKSEADKAATLKKSEKVTLICEGNGRIMKSPHLDDCTISGTGQ